MLWWHALLERSQISLQSDELLGSGFIFNCGDTKSELSLRVSAQRDTTYRILLLSAAAVCNLKDQLENESAHEFFLRDNDNGTWHCRFLGS